MKDFHPFLYALQQIPRVSLQTFIPRLLWPLRNEKDLASRLSWYVDLGRVLHVQPHSPRLLGTSQIIRRFDRKMSKDLRRKLVKQQADAGLKLVKRGVDSKGKKNCYCNAGFEVEFALPERLLFVGGAVLPRSQCTFAKYIGL